MGTLFSYSLASGIFLLFGFAAYRLLMAGEKQPGLNCAALLGLYAASLAAPALTALPGNGTVPAAVTSPAAGIGEIAVMAAAEPPATSVLPGMILWIYLAGAAVALLGSTAGFLRLAAIIRRGRRATRDGYTLIVIPENCVPFSFARYIVMGEADAARGDSMVATHELGHLRHRHWLDLLLAQAVCVMMWYNPAAWLTRRELRRVHEYQADSAVIGRGVNLRAYQMLLIEKAAGVRLQSVANSLDHSNLSKRITMMYKQSNRVSRRLRALALAPALILAAALVNSPAVASALSAASEAALSQPKTDAKAPAVKGKIASVGKSTEKSDNKEKSDEPYRAVAVMPEFPGGMSALMRYLGQNVKYPESAYNAGIQGRVVVDFVVGADGMVRSPKVIRSVSPDLDAEAVRVIGTMPQWAPGKNEKGEAVSCHFTIPVQFSLTKDDGTTAKSASTSAKSAPSTPSTTTTTTTITTTNGKTTSISETKSSNGHMTFQMDGMTVESTPGEPHIRLNSARYAPGASEAPAYFVNGKPYTGSLDELKPDQIKSITVKKDDPAYPNGLLLIETK